MTWDPGAESCRHTDPSTGVTAEVATDGVPVGLALPERLLDRRPEDVAAACLRALVGAAGLARDLLEQLAEEEWEDEQEADAAADGARVG